MSKPLFKILFAFIALSFFISATEMDLGESHNTFFDDFDTYVKHEDPSYEVVYTVFKKITGLSNTNNCTFKAIFLYSQLLVRSLNNYYYTPSCRKLFLDLSVWRI